jgi:predicted metal-dependent RNase
MAKLNGKVEITTSMITGKERSISEKWELISTHTARRSGCTNMFLAGIEVPVIMSFSGHSTEKSFKKYIKASSLQVAMKVKDHPFFKEKISDKE